MLNSPRSFSGPGARPRDRFARTRGALSRSLGNQDTGRTHEWVDDIADLQRELLDLTVDAGSDHGLASSISACARAASALVVWAGSSLNSGSRLDTSGACSNSFCLKCASQI
jgi:hypothetical protein